MFINLVSRWPLVIIVLATCFVTSPLLLRAADLYAILIGDCLTEDIREASNLDLTNMFAEIDKIAQSGGYQLHVKTLNCQRPCARKVVRALKALHPTEDDVVIFYYSGHGYRTSASNQWPNLSFAIERVGLSFSDVIQVISEKKAGFSLILADCCNWPIPRDNAPSEIKIKSVQAILDEGVRRNYCRLFGELKGVVAIASSRAGQPSYCTADGSFYSMCFVKALQKSVSADQISDWNEILRFAARELQGMLQPFSLAQDPVLSLKIQPRK